MDIKKMALLDRLYKKGIEIDHMVVENHINCEDICKIEAFPRIFRFFTGPITDTVSFSKFSDEEKDILSRLSPEQAETASKLTLSVSKKFKAFIDKKFGKGKYVFVSIGRSPVMLGRGLEGMGVEAKYIPISGLHPRHNVHGDTIHNTLDFIKLEKFIEYLKSIGLSAEKVQKDGRKFIFYDYTSSGDTLREIKRFFRKKMGLPLFRSEFRSLNDDISKVNQSLRQNQNATETTANVAFVEEYLFRSKGNIFSHIPKLNFFEANKVFDAIRNFKPDNQVRFFNFNILNLLEKAGLLVQKQN